MTRAVIGLRGVSGHAGEAASLSSAGPLINYIRIPPDRRPSDPGRAALLARATRSTLRPPQRLPARPKSASAQRMAEIKFSLEASRKTSFGLTASPRALIFPRCDSIDFSSPLLGERKAASRLSR